MMYRYKLHIYTLLYVTLEEHLHPVSMHKGQERPTINAKETYYQRERDLCTSATISSSLAAVAPPTTTTPLHSPPSDIARAAPGDCTETNTSSHAFVQAASA